MQLDLACKSLRRSKPKSLLETFDFSKQSAKTVFHYGLKFSVAAILNFPLESPSQIAPNFFSLVEQCRTKIQIKVEAGYDWEGFNVKICLKKCEEAE